MRIIDKNQDFYDYYSHIYGEDKSIAFDRRGSIFLTDEMIVGCSKRDLHSDWSTHTLYGFRILEVGDVQYLIKVSNVKFINDYMNLIYDKLVSYTFDIVYAYQDHKHRYKTPMSLHTVDFSWDWKQKVHHYEIYPDENKNITPIELPILANTSLTKLLNPDTIWKELCNYISSLKNDKNVDIGTTDIEKVINHGFDKKESFRGERK
jgi:hypothetical protein